MNLKKSIIISIFILLTYSYAQSLTGKYILQEGGVVLVLEQQADNKVLGILTGPEASFELEGELSPDDANTAYGYIFTGDSKLLFAIVLEEPSLNMIAFAILENGDPDPDDTETFVFLKETSTGTSVPNTTNTTSNTPVSPNTANRLPTNNQPLNTNPDTTTETQTANPQSNPLNPTTSSSSNNPLSAQNPLAAKDSFIGIFVGDGLKLELAKEAEAFSGKLEFNGQTFPLTASKNNTTLIGTFKVGENTFSFSAALTVDTLRFVTDGTSYTLHRQ